MTKQITHTPGPWEWLTLFGSSELVAYIKGETFLNGQPRYKITADDGSACGEYNAIIDPDSPDARLIAAAPDLLAALEEAVEWDGHDETGEPAVWLSQARAAIAKAKGEV